ncbi:MAG: type II toxin-antitoxin system RelB/DinJ family antitoxin [Oscillospiraceae bacterium]|nr:type II toxin-antitoxin system RelB/DinJ family antitoxin [Oscillospiraceae bacterium]
MEMANINISMDKNLKEEAESLFSELGMNMATAINIFVSQAVRKGKIPFEISLNEPNAETLEAMQEIEDMISGKLPENPQSIKDLLEELDINVNN